MGYLLKEALKTLCGVKQWSYAVFWKFGCQNLKLLIWEECYHALVSSSSAAGISSIEEWEACCVSGSYQFPQVGVLAEDKIPSLINKMILADRVKIVGQGLVGRAAFTGNHFWILSEGYSKETHPPEVQNEVCEQFFAGIKTLAVIPIFTHGVVQFGSSSAIRENMTFVNDVKNLILQVGCVPGAFLSDNYITREPASKFEIPSFQNESIFLHPSGNCKLKDSFHQHSVIAQPPDISHPTVPQFQANPQVNITESQDRVSLINAVSIENQSLHLGSQFNSERGRVYESNQECWVSQQPLLQSKQSRFDGQPVAGPSNVNYGNLGIDGGCNFSDSLLQEYVSNNLSLSESSIHSQFNTSGGFSSSPVSLHGGLSDDFLRSLLNPTVDTLYSTPAVSGVNGKDKCSQADTVRRKEKDENDSMENISGFNDFIQKNMSVNLSPRPGSSGEDLFDILGSDFKSKIFGNSWNGSNAKAVQDNNLRTDYQQYADSDVYSVREGNSEGMFSRAGAADHLLDAVVCKVPSGSIQKIDIGIPCGTTLTNISSCSGENTSPSSSQLKASNQMQGKLSEVPLSFGKLAGIGSGSFKSEKEDSGSYSQTNSLFGSQLSSWVEQGQPSGKQNSGGSKKGQEGGKPNRKRLKPGESPRPRPKDRQMIQDRMKELREIVPNGAKLSIDALLERTIKHMLFLQSVAKHADKLKENGESKIINKDGGLILRDGFEGGRTWACEVGSQNMVCPIIVEDLNTPRQMLIEMLCEERGLFLEIADIIRGLGLTILKGVIETRINKIWARFAVEADRDVTRMEIFLSLVHLLEQTIKSGPSSCNEIDTNVMSLHQVASIPATGRPL